MVELFKAREMQKLDVTTIEEIGIPGILLMEHAGYKSAYVIKTLFPDKKRVAVVCGKGNNGGDGFVVARWLYHWGWDVEVLLVGNPNDIKGDAKINYEIAKSILGDRIIVLPDLNKIEATIRGCEVIVDAILGTGFTGKVAGFYKEVIDLINARRNKKKVVSIDIPSGISADSGKVEGSAIMADVTVTFGRLKVGQFVYPARKHVGEVFLADIGIPKNLKGSQKIFLVEEEDILDTFTEREEDAHKGNFGHIMIITGSPGKTGAGIMAGISAIRIGVGLATLIVPKSLNPIYESATLEVMSEPVEDTDGFINKKAIDKILTTIERASALAIGPGLGQFDETVYVLQEVIKSTKVPVVIDADGINLLAKNLSILEKKKAPIILTPHPGEFMRLTKEPRERVLNERLEVSIEWAKKLDTIIVLKGAGTITATPDGKAYINATGNPGMATGGSGDVLTGIIGGLLAMGIDPVKSAYGGVFIHGLSGDLAREVKGSYGLIASDMIKQIPYILSSWERGIRLWKGIYKSL